MGKKKVKKINSLSSSYNYELGQHNQSMCKNSEMACDFKISLVPYTDDPDSYYRWIKGWKNVAFVHPSVILAFRCSFLLINGKNTASIFIPYSLKTVKKSSIIVLNDMGFEHEEVVFIYPFKGNGYEAENVRVNLQPNIVLTDSIKDLVWMKLSKRFMWPDLKMTLELFEIKYEINITKVQPTAQIVLRNTYNTFCKENNVSKASQLLTFENASNTSVTKSDSFVAFSPMFLSDCTDSTNSHHMSRVLPSQVETSAFFTLSYKTNIIFCNETCNAKPKSFDLIKNISRISDEIHSMKKAIDEFFTLINQKVLNHHHVLLLVDSLESETNLEELKTIYSEYNDVHIEEIIINKLYYKHSTDLLAEMKQKFRIANKRAPCILLLDQFEDLFAGKDQYLLDTLQDLIATCDKKVLILASITDSSKYDKKIFSSCLVQEIKNSSSAVLDNEEIIRKTLKEIQHNLSPSEIKQCIELSQGLKRKEMHAILKYDAKFFSLIRMRNMPKSEGEIVENIKFCDVKAAIKKKKSKIMSSNSTPKKVRWEDIGGMTEIKEKLKEELELFQMCPKNLKRFNYEPSKGILLYGPPGCSKTMIAQALANECNWNFISKKSSDLLNMYVGESEKAVVQLFLDARARSPCIIFLDEIDALAPERTSCSTASGVQNRIVNALLTEIAGIETLKDITVIAATNRPDVVDKAFLRSGRIGLHIYVPLPNSDSRKEIFKLCMKKRCIGEDVDFNFLVQQTNGYTGAEIVHVCNEAAMQLLFDDPDCKSPLFTMLHFERALLAIPPRTTKETIKFYEQFNST